MWAFEVVCSTAVLEQTIEDDVTGDRDGGAFGNPGSFDTLPEKISAYDRSNRSCDFTNESE